MRGAQRHRAFVNAENRLVEPQARLIQAGIRIAGDDVGVVVTMIGNPVDNHRRNRRYVFIRFNSERRIRDGMAVDLDIQVRPQCL